MDAGCLLPLFGDVKIDICDLDPKKRLEVCCEIGIPIRAGKTDRAGVSPNGNAVLTEIAIETRSSESELEEDWKTLAITSALEQEGKSYVFVAEFICQ